MSDDLSRVQQLAETFLTELSTTLDNTLGELGSQDLEVIRARKKVSIGPSSTAIPLTVEGKHRLNLVVRYSLTLSTNKSFLAVDHSEFKVFPVDDDPGSSFGPLVAFDYRRDPASKDVPTAHLNLDTSNSSILYMLAESGNSRRIRNRREKALKNLRKDSDFGSEHGSERDVHIPVGGARFRPCLEDVLEMLIVEFGVDHSGGSWREALARGRRRWREHQLRAAVNDNPGVAAQQLRNLGFTVIWDDDGEHPTPNLSKLGRF